MASSTISIVLRCAVLLVLSVEVRGGVPVATRPSPVRDGSQDTDTEVEPHPAGPHCRDESMVLEVAEVHCQVQRSLDRLDDIEDALKLVLNHVTDERVILQRSLDKLAGIEARPTERNVCTSNYCQNGGTCVDENTSFRCECLTGYNGVHCELNVDECLSNPCQNGATCSDGVNGYTCVCADGYSGTTCGMDIDECSSDPCHNGATCVVGVNGYTCTCVSGYTGTSCGVVTHRDCKDVRTAMGSVSGVYTVTPYGGTPTHVYCDMDTSGGGWLVFQKRVNGSVDFYLNWESYAGGFGDLNGEFWLGNRNLHLLTAQKCYTLRVVLSDWEGNQAYAEYMNFTIGSEQDKFRLTVGGYSGTAGDSLHIMMAHSGMLFSTRDQDNDLWSGWHCALERHGGWWHYNWCGESNLNGRYYRGGPYTGTASGQIGSWDGVFWKQCKGYLYSLKSTTMMIRPAP